MTENKQDDRLLQAFFAESKQEIADNGFTRRVMQHLPGRKQRIMYVWNVLIIAVSTTIFFCFDGVEAVGHTLAEAFGNMLQTNPISIDSQSLTVAVLVLLCMGIKEIYSKSIE